MSSPTIPPSPRSVLLGWFILVQIVFLFASNLLGFAQWFPSLDRRKPNELINRALPRFAQKQGNAWQWSEQADANLRRWTELTGQDQAWSLFAPTVSKSTGFPAVLLSWDEPYSEDAGFAGAVFSFDEQNGFGLHGDWNHPPTARQPSLAMGSQLGILTAQSPWEAMSLGEANRAFRLPTPRMELLLSENEPLDLHGYLRITKCRVRKFEGNFYIGPKPWKDEAPGDLANRLTGRVREFAGDYNDLAVSYLRWRLKTWRSAHPDEPMPKQVILLERYFRIHGPEEKERGWDGPYVVPLARWLPGHSEQNVTNLLEPFDFSEQRFLPKTPLRQ